LTVGRHGDSDVTAMSIFVVNAFVVDDNVEASLMLTRAGTSLADNTQLSFTALNTVRQSQIYVMTKKRSCC